jgi:hypothetical protein
MVTAAFLDVAAQLEDPGLDVARSRAPRLLPQMALTCPQNHIVGAAANRCLV